MIYAEILGGGSGKRFGDTNLPKQFQILGNKPIIIHTLEQFIINPKFDKVIVCLPQEWITYTEDLINKYISNPESIKLIVGGATRNETIMKGCKYIEETYGLNNNDIIVTHDAVRPFVNQRIINDNINAMKKYDATDTAITAADTIINIEKDGIISSIPDRSKLFLGQTPQSFKIKKLMNLFNSLTVEEKDILTDACKIFTLKGEKVKVVAGETFNIKITTVFDLSIANAILKVRDHD